MVPPTAPEQRVFWGFPAPPKRPSEPHATAPPPILDAAVTSEIVRDARPGASREVGRRADYGYFKWTHHSDGDHISVRAVLGSDTGVESLRHNIDRRFAELELEVNLRVGR